MLQVTLLAQIAILNRKSGSLTKKVTHLNQNLKVVTEVATYKSEADPLSIQEGRSASAKALRQDCVRGEARGGL